MIKNAMIGSKQIENLYIGKYLSWRKMFSILSLFKENHKGFWFEPSDLKTLFQDSAGTVLVTKIGDPISLLLDKSQNLEENIIVDVKDTSIPTSAYSASTIIEGINLTGDYKVRLSIPSLADSQTAEIRFRYWQNSGVDEYGQMVTLTGGQASVINIAFNTCTKVQVQIFYNNNLGMLDTQIYNIKGNHAKQTVSSKRSTYNVSPARITTDKVDDEFAISIPTGGWSGTMIVATTIGTASYEVNLPAGNFLLGRPKSKFDKNIVGVVLRSGSLTKEEKTSTKNYFLGKGAVETYNAVISFDNFWFDCKDTTEFPLIDTSSGISFYQAWVNNSGLIDFPLIDTSLGTILASAWTNCTQLKSFPLLDTSSATNLSRSWSGCSSLTNFPLISTSSVTNMNYTWYNCNSLRSFPLINTSSCINFSYAWYNGSSLTSFPLINTSSGADFTYAWYGCSGLTNFPSIDTTKGTNMSYAWHSCSSLVSFPLLVTSKVTQIVFAWRDCLKLTSFPLIDTSIVTSMYGAWTGCSGLINFPLINTSSVTNISWAWYGCRGLTSFPLINTSSVTNMSTAWNNCSKLTSFPLIDTSRVTQMYTTWSGCTSLTSFPLLNTSLVTEMFGTWNSCSKLSDFPLINTSSVTDMSATWYNCTSLADFPANMFDNVKTGNFSNTFTNTALTQTSIDNILTSLVTSAITIGTRVFGQAGGSAPSITGTNAIDTLRSRGWTITVTGGY